MSTSFKIAKDFCHSGNSGKTNDGDDLVDDCPDCCVLESLRKGPLSFRHAGSSCRLRHLRDVNLVSRACDPVGGHTRRDCRGGSGCCHLRTKLGFGVLRNLGVSLGCRARKACSGGHALCDGVSCGIHGVVGSTTRCSTTAKDLALGIPGNNRLSRDHCRSCSCAVHTRIGFGHVLKGRTVSTLNNTRHQLIHHANTRGCCVKCSSGDLKMGPVGPLIVSPVGNARTLLKSFG